MSRVAAGAAVVALAGALMSCGSAQGAPAPLAVPTFPPTVVATTPLRLITLFKRDVWALEREAPEAAKRLRELLASRTMPPAVSG